MRLMNGLLGDFGCVMADTDHHHSTGQPIALTGVCVETLLALARSPGTSSAQELVENIILPRTKGQGCGYAQTLAPTKRGRPTVYVSIAWEAPLRPALHAVLLHLGVPSHLLSDPLSAPNEDIHSSSHLNSQSSNSSSLHLSTSTHAILPHAFVFIDFLCINLWGARMVSEPAHAHDGAHARAGSTNPSFDGKGDDSDDGGDRTSSRMLRSVTRHRLGGPLQLEHSNAKIKRKASCPDLVKKSKRSLLSQIDTQLFLASIRGVLSPAPDRAHAAGPTFLLYLDPDLRCLGSLVPMHAAWRAMHAGLPMQLVCSPDLVWPRYLGPANLAFSLSHADMPDQGLGETLLADIRASFSGAERASLSCLAGNASTTHHLEHLSRQLSSAGQALWKALLQAAATGAAAAAAKGVAPAQPGDSGGAGDEGRRFVYAVFLALDGQYREACSKLARVQADIAARHGELSNRSVQALCWLAQALLQQGNLAEAERVTEQALKACEAKGEHLTSLFLHASACHALVLEALGRAGAAEQVLRDVYIDLDRQLGPRHPRTLEFMAHLGRSVSRMEGRQEEGALLLTECLKAVARLCGSKVCDTLFASLLNPYAIRPPPADLGGDASARQMQLLLARLSRDLAVVRKQLAAAAAAAAAADEDDDSAAPVCNVCVCSNRIVEAFQALDESERRANACAPSGPDAWAAEAEHLWRQCIVLQDAACGPHHEAACLERARRAAAAVVAPPPVHGKGSPTAAGPAALVGTAAHGARGSAGDAADAVRGELVLLRHALGPLPSMPLVEAQQMLAGVLEVQGALGGALAQWDAVAEGLEQLLGGDSVHVASAQARLSACLAAQGKFDDASRAAAAAAAATAAATGRLSPQTGAAIVAEAEVLRAGGDLRAAEGALGRAIEVFVACYGANNWRTKQVYNVLYDVYEAQGRAEDAASLSTKFKLRR